MLTIAAPLSVKNIYFNARRRYKRHVVSLSEGPIGLKKTHTHMYKSLLLLLARVGICDSLTFATPLPAPPQLTLLFYLSVSLHQSKFPDCSQEPCFRDFFFFSLCSFLLLHSQFGTSRVLAHSATMLRYISKRLVH